MYLSQPVKCICLKLQNVFVPNFKMYFSRIGKMYLSQIAPLKDLGENLLKPFSADVSIAPVPSLIQEVPFLFDRELDLEHRQEPSQPVSRGSLLDLESELGPVSSLPLSSSLSWIRTTTRLASDSAQLDLE